jgi:hypothetical protein
MSTICDKCRRGGQGSQPPLPAGTGGSLYMACPQFENFHLQLCQAVSKGTELLRIATTLEIPASKVNTTGVEDVAQGWLRVLGLAAKSGKLPQLAKLASKGPPGAPSREAYPLERLLQQAGCGFINYEVLPSAVVSASLPRSQSSYLMCDRKDEWEAFAATRDSNTVVPLIALGPEQEALDLLLRRIERCLDNYDVISVKWESDYPPENRYAELQLALRRALLTPTAADAAVPELLQRSSPTVLLHPLLRLREDSPESDLNSRYLLEYYERLAQDLSRLSPAYPAPFVVQCISWDGSEHERARAVAEEIAKHLATVEPKPQVIQYALKPIPNDDVKSFLLAHGKLALWPKVSRDIHHVNWPVPLGRKSSRVVYEALFNAFSSHDASSSKSRA